MQTDTQTWTEWHREINRYKKEKKSKNTNTVVNAALPDTEYLYYPLDVEGFTLKGLFLPAAAR